MGGVTNPKGLLDGTPTPIHYGTPKGGSRRVDPHTANLKFGLGKRHGGPFVQKIPLGLLLGVGASHALRISTISLRQVQEMILSTFI